MGEKNTEKMKALDAVLLQIEKRKTTYKPLPKFPAVERDFAMLCDKDNDDFLVSLGERVFALTDFKVCDMIEETEFME